MFRFTIPAVLGLLVIAAPLPAQPPAVLVRDWYLRYLHREPEPAGMQGWVWHLRQGRSPQFVEAHILASSENYTRVGQTPAGFTDGLFRDVLNRAPTAEEFDPWAGRVARGEPRLRVAYDFLGTYQAAGPSGPLAAPVQPGWGRLWR